jgi:glycolate oxidase FAD binding subunit
MTPPVSALTPASVPDLIDAVRSARRVVAVGAGTKPRLAQVPAEFRRISMAKLSGIVDYEPSEFTFTALAGTPLREIAAEVAQRGQYLPFDPMLAGDGATLGGTVAAGLSGPGRFRFGGLRDFILGVRFVDGDGRLLRLGGRVVKNAAGFDVPKFFVGSAGRFGVMAELTFKVFPRPVALRTLRLEAKDTAAQVKMIQEAANTRWEIDAMELSLEESAVWIRLGGPAVALDALTAEIAARWPARTLDDGAAAEFWSRLAGFRWAHLDGTLVKLALAPGQVVAFRAQVQAIAGARGWVSNGGNTGYLSLPAGTPVPALTWPAVTLRGNGPLWPGPTRRFEAMRAVKAALDPQDRFPNLDE